MIARVRAIKKIPPIVPMLDFESTELEMRLGSVISKRPKKERAKTRKIAAKKIFNVVLVEILFRIFASFAFRK